MADKDEEEKEEAAGNKAAWKAHGKVAKEAMDVAIEQDAATGNYSSNGHDNPEVRKRAAKAAKEGRAEGKAEYRNRRLIRQLLHDNPRSRKLQDEEDDE